MGQELVALGSTTRSGRHDSHDRGWLCMLPGLAKDVELQEVHEVEVLV